VGAHVRLRDPLVRDLFIQFDDRILCNRDSMQCEMTEVLRSSKWRAEFRVGVPSSACPPWIFIMDPTPSDRSPKASGSKILPQQMRRSSSARASYLVHDSVQSQPTIPEDESNDAAESSGQQQTKSSLWHRLGLDVTLGYAEWGVLLVSTCIKLLLFPA